MIQKEIDGLRIRVWLAELMYLTGCQTIKELAARLDPGSVWIDDDEIEHQSKWYQYSKGVQVPSEALIARLQKHVAGAKFELHHPVWAVLRRECSERTWSRMRSRLPGYWHLALSNLALVPSESLQPSLALVNTLKLYELSYLDSLALFVCGRRHAVRQSNLERVRQIDWLLWTLPVLYAEDQIWHTHDFADLCARVVVLDRGLGLPDVGAHATRYSTAQEIVLCCGDVVRHRQRYPSAFRTYVSLRRFLAARWSNFSRVVSTARRI